MGEVRGVHGVEVTVRRSGGSDRFGNPLPPVERSVVVWGFAPAGSTEFLSGQATVSERDIMYAPFDVDVTSQDVVVVGGGQPLRAGAYQVDGTPQRWRNPFTSTPGGTVVRLVAADRP